MIIILKGIPRILSPNLLIALMEMGHGDEIVISDGNFPAASCAKRLIRCDRLDIPELLDAILPFFPIDYTMEKPTTLMEAPMGIDYPPIWEQYRKIINKYDTNAKEFNHIERFSFYERARNAYAVVATGEKSRYANIILKKGVVIF